MLYFRPSSRIRLLSNPSLDRVGNDLGNPANTISVPSLGYFGYIINTRYQVLHIMYETLKYIQRLNNAIAND